jgi:hypothetical protein
MSTMPRKKLGNDTPMSVTLVASRSTTELRLIAERMPMTSANVIEMRIAAAPSSTVAGSRSMIARDALLVLERPPEVALDDVRQPGDVLDGSGLSRPRSCGSRQARPGRRSSPANDDDRIGRRQAARARRRRR